MNCPFKVSSEILSFPLEILGLTVMLVLTHYFTPFPAVLPTVLLLEREPELWQSSVLGN